MLNFGEKIANHFEKDLTIDRAEITQISFN